MRPDGVSDLRSGAHVHGGFGTGASDRPRMPTLGTHCAAGVEIEVEVLRPLLFEMGLLFSPHPKPLGGSPSPLLIPTVRVVRIEGIV